jgi:hypothetical protein
MGLELIELKDKVALVTGLMSDLKFRILDFGPPWCDVLGTFCCLI